MRNECQDAVTEELEKAGVPYTIDVTSRHVHIRFGVEREHLHVVAKTASDWRAEKNERALIKRELKRLGYVEASDEPETEQRPAIMIKDGDLRCSSVDVAKNFGKVHRDVLRAIDTCRESCGSEFDLRNFAQIEYVDPRGRSYRAYEMSRDGFSLVVMGFTGQAAMQWKVKYINAFSEMEGALRGLSVSPDMSGIRAELDAVVELLASVESKEAKPARYAPPRMIRRQQERRAARSAA